MDISIFLVFCVKTIVFYYNLIMLTNEQIKNLNELENFVYSKIIFLGKEILNLKITDLAKIAHVSTTTILRFCKKAGCNGFSEFKIKYRLYLNEKKDFQYGFEFSYLLDYFNKIDKKVFDNKIEEVSKILLSKRSVNFVGVGSSGIVAKYGAHFFNSLDINSSYNDDPFLSFSNIDFSDVAIIAISISGNTSQTLQHILKCKEKKAFIISITNQEDCLIAKCSDRCFCHYLNEEFYGHYNITTHIPSIFIIEMIAKKIKKLKEL